MRGSLFRPAETSFASAPTCSHKRAISLMKVMDNARNEFKACLTISADSVRMNKICDVNGANNFSSKGFWESSRMPTMTRSAFSNESIALPSRKFSGEEAKWNCGNSFSSWAHVPTGSSVLRSKQRAFGQILQRAPEIIQNRGDIRFIVFIDRRVVSQPEHIRLRAGCFWIGGEGKILTRDA